MPKTKSNEGSEEMPADALTVVQFANVFPYSAVTNCLDSHNCGTIRFGKLPNERLVYFQMMLSVFRKLSQNAVYRSVAAALDALAVLLLFFCRIQLDRSWEAGLSWFCLRKLESGF